MLISNLNSIYLTLIGLTDLCMKNNDKCLADEEEYYCLEDDEEALQEALEEENAYNFYAKDFRD